MPTRDSSPLGAPCWVDLMTSDVERARAFYGEIFGWTSESAGEEFGGYVNFSLEGAGPSEARSAGAAGGVGGRGVRVAGCMQNDPSWGVPDAWSVYLHVADTAATVEAAKAGGAQVHAEPTEIGPLGTMAVVADPGGASIGMWQPGEFDGFGVIGEHGSVSWCELFTRDDYASTIAFYEKVFGWTTRAEGDTPEFRYTTLVVGDEQEAGVMDASAFLPEGVPNHWSVYFEVDDVDKTVALTTDLGGNIVAPAEDTPYGRLATVTDPTGAQFKLRKG